MRAGWFWVEAASRLLASDEREAVLGDLLEADGSASSALLSVLGLVMRREAQHWKSWRPWLVLIGFIGPVAVLLSSACQWLTRTYDLNLWLLRNYRDLDPAVLSETGLSIKPGLLLMVRNSLLLFCWSWACGWVLGTLSRRMVWVNGSLFCLLLLLFPSRFHAPYQYSVTGWLLPMAFYTAILPLLLKSGLIFFPLLWGLHQGQQGSDNPLLRPLLWTSAVVATFAARSWFWWPMKNSWQMQLLLLSVYWPIGYLAFTKAWQRYTRRITVT